MRLSLWVSKTTMERQSLGQVESKTPRLVGGASGFSEGETVGFVPSAGSC